MQYSSLNLVSRKKHISAVTSRVKPVKETVKTVAPLCRTIGVTRIADITHMDILSIPNYSAILPGTEDYIWVYSGKGTTKLEAKASVMMECVERYCSLPKHFDKKIIQGSYDELSKSYPTLHPNEVVEPVRFEYTSDMPMDFIFGFDLFSNKEIIVPASLSLFRYSPKLPSINPFAYHHTNGLASGNVIEEAICHALCEVIERDATSLAQLRTSAIPFNFLHQIHNSLVANDYPLSPLPMNKFVDDFGVFPDVDISELHFEAAERLIERFSHARIPLIIKDITSDIGIPTFNASSIEWLTHNYGYLTEGHGAHIDARIALLRAITEVSQTRAANIQGARDDLRKITFGENNTDDKRSWQFMRSKSTVKFSSIKSLFNEDILDDIKYILSALKRAGLTKAIIVDLTNDNIGIPVVRAIVPGLETFKITKSVIGWRGMRYTRNN